MSVFFNHFKFVLFLAKQLPLEQQYQMAEAIQKFIQSFRLKPDVKANKTIEEATDIISVVGLNLKKAKIDNKEPKNIEITRDLLDTLIKDLDPKMKESLNGKLFKNNDHFKILLFLICSILHKLELVGMEEKINWISKLSKVSMIVLDGLI